MHQFRLLVSSEQSSFFCSYMYVCRWLRMCAHPVLVRNAHRQPIDDAVFQQKGEHFWTNFGKWLIGLLWQKFWNLHHQIKWNSFCFFVASSRLENFAHFSPGPVRQHLHEPPRAKYWLNCQNMCITQMRFCSDHRTGQCNREMKF